MKEIIGIKENELIVEYEYVNEMITDIMHDCRVTSKEIHDVKYHHNRSYHSTPKVIKHGILSLKESVNLGLIKLSDEELIKYNLYDHVNGINQVSIASTDVDYSRLYRDEIVYCPFSSSSTDILLSSDVKAFRNTTHYYNEFLADDMIEPKYFRSVDIRILKEISERLRSHKGSSSLVMMEEIIAKYNKIRDIASSIINTNLDIPLREMSEENITLDLDKISKAPVLVLK